MDKKEPMIWCSYRSLSSDYLKGPFLAHVEVADVFFIQKVFENAVEAYRWMNALRKEISDVCEH